MVLVQADPYSVKLELASTCLLIIDMQRDFLELGGFGEALGNDVSLLQAVVDPVSELLSASRFANMTVIHTREGHRPDLSDVNQMKLGHSRIGAMGPMGRILIRGEPGHDIIPKLAPLPGEPVIDKPGKGAFYSTDLDLMLRSRGIRNLVICGVTTEVCVHSTVREANDRGYRCLVVSDGCSSYFPEFHAAALRMISAQGGIFGYVTKSSDLIASILNNNNKKI